MSILKRILKHRITRIIITLISLALLVLLVKYGCGDESEYEYTFEKAARGEVVKTISATGVLEVKGAEPVLTKINGIIDKIYVEAEQRVQKGQLLASFESLSISEKILRQTMNVENKNLQLMAEKQRFEGKKSMFEDKLISKKDLEQTELEYKKAQYEYKLALFDLNEMKRHKQETRIVSPISGVVLAVDIIENAALQAGTPAFVIAPDLTKMLLVINIDEADIGNVKKKQKVIFTVSAFPEREFYGDIEMVSINPFKQSGGLVTYQSHVLCDNTELLLKPGMTATSTIVVSRKNNVLRVPNQAFIVAPEFSFQKSDEKVLWLRNDSLIDKEPAKKVPVVQGLAGDMYTEIVSGIKPGDQVLVKIEKK